MGETAEGSSESTLARLAKLTDAVYVPVIHGFEDVGSTLMLGVQTMLWAFRPPFRPAQLLIALDFVGAGSTFIVALVGLFTGVAFTVSTILGFRQFSAEGMVGGVVALAMARELAPVLASVVVCARAGSTMASELGNMRVTEQIDAITTMGVSPIQYLISPRVVATTLMMPLLATCFGVAGQGGAYLVAVVWQDIDPGVFFDKIHRVPAGRRPSHDGREGRCVWVRHEPHLLQEGFLGVRWCARCGEATAKAVVASIVAIFAFDYLLTTLMTDI